MDNPLLNIFNNLIELYGGREATLRIIEQEMAQGEYKTYQPPLQRETYNQKSDYQRQKERLFRRLIHS